MGAIRIEDSRLSFVDEAAARHIELASLDLTTDEVVPGEPLTDTAISGVLHVAGFARHGVPFALRVPKLDAPADFSAVQVEEFEISFGGLEAEGAIRGTLGDHPRLEGSLETNAFDPRALLTALGIAAPATTDPEALGKLQLAGGWKFEDGAVAIDPFTLLLDDTRLAGNVRMAAGAGPGEFSLRGGRVDVAR